jgi:hypothetical protein
MSIPEENNIEKILVGKELFDYYREQFIGLLATIDKNRDILNYNIVGVLAFSGLIYGDISIKFSDTRKIIVFINLFIVFCIWVYTNFSDTFSVGVNPKSMLDLARTNNKLPNNSKYYQNNDDFWGKAVDSINAEYAKLSLKQSRIMIFRNICLLFSIIYVFIVIFFLNFSQILL